MKSSCYLFFDIFASKTRIKIIKAIWKKPKSVQEICSATGIEQSNVSHQLTLMQRCHIVRARSKGKHRIYKLEKSIEPIISAAEVHTKKHCTKKCTDWLKRNKK